jgi:uncharacterized membrane protein
MTRPFGATLAFLGGASAAAGAMYLMDPQHGARRRAELVEAIDDLRDHELVERARHLEPLAAVRRLDARESMRDAAVGLKAALPRLAEWRELAQPARWSRLARRGRYAGRRKRTPALDAAGWATLGLVLAAGAVAVWIALRARPGGMEIIRSVTVDAPIDRVFEAWSNFEGFPRFMAHVREVRRTGPDRTHWVVAGPAGVPVEWDAITTERVVDEAIAWQTVEGAVVDHAGAVRFRPLGDGRTVMDVRMCYRPVGGALGHDLAALLGGDPGRVMDEDLARFAAQVGGRQAVGESGRWR